MKSDSVLQSKQLSPLPHGNLYSRGNYIGAWDSEQHPVVPSFIVGTGTAFWKVDPFQTTKSTLYKDVCMAKSL
jgi:hypothetical protein